jgi:hypothetical protein
VTREADNNTNTGKTEPRTIDSTTIPFHGLPYQSSLSSFSPSSPSNSTILPDSASSVGIQPDLPRRFGFILRRARGKYSAKR